MRVAKLNQRRIRWIVRHCAELKDSSTREVAEIYGISQWRGSADPEGVPRNRRGSDAEEEQETQNTSD